jgi:hypothetical protein
MRYSIMVLERFGVREVALCECDSSPEAIVRALQAKRTKRLKRPRFASIRVVDNHIQNSLTDAASRARGEALLRASTHHEPETEKDLTVKASEAFPSRFLSSADIKLLGRDIIDVIEYVKTEELEGQDRKQRKRVAYLRNNKPFVLNRTNWDLLADLLGNDDDDHWTGAKVQIGVEKVRFGRDTVDGLRVKNARYEANNKSRVQSASPAPPVADEPSPATSAAEFGLGDEINDELPF